MTAEQAAENPRLKAYNTLVAQSKLHSLLSMQGELLNTNQTEMLILSALNAFEAGLSRAEIGLALDEGTIKGVTRWQQLQARNDPDYWESVEQEIEGFWEARSRL